jgi:2-polyprenyl-6-methoxyphenol hydroxylase-like FAD-dependent oxidoreductase
VSDVDTLVVGGGIGGLGAAIALSRQGLRVRVLERARQFGEVGAGIQLAPNCTRILAEYGLLEEAKRRGALPTSMVMRDAVDGSELTRMDLVDLERTYGSPYIVIHRSDLHGLLVEGCRAAGVDLVTDAEVTAYRQDDRETVAVLADGREERASVVIAADGLHSVARRLLSDDQPRSSAYVAYRAAAPVTELASRELDLSEVVVYVGPRCHFVRYGLRGGLMVNQVAVFESPKALAGEEDWGTPDELEAAFSETSDLVRAGIPLMWRDRWWRMYDRDPIMTWVQGRIALLGDAAHPPLQYLAQGAVMAIEDGWVLGEHVRHHRRPDGTVGWAPALEAYEAVRSEHCRRVVHTARAWGALWHLDGDARLQRNALLRARAIDDYSFTDWLYGPTALVPEDEPPMFPSLSLATSP